jgi:hypothetical protein
LALAAFRTLGNARQVEKNRRFVTLYPATDQVLDDCDGPTVTGRCPVADSPQYICAGLHLVGAEEAGHDVSLTVTRMTRPMW